MVIPLYLSQPTEDDELHHIEGTVAGFAFCGVALDFERESEHTNKCDACRQLAGLPDLKDD